MRSIEESTSALDAFTPEETGRSELRPANAPSSTRPPVSLADLRAARIVLDADEAVAIGQALCLAFIRVPLLRRLNQEPDATTLSSPVATDSVLINANGGVSLADGAPREAPVAIQSVGEILLEITPADTLLSLRPAIISKALASPPHFGTLEELSKALAVYERPNGKALIQTVYEFWEREMSSKATTPSIAPTTPPAPIPDSRPKAPASRSIYPLAVVAGVVVAASITIPISAWFLMSRPPLEARTLTHELAMWPQQAEDISATREEIAEPTPLEGGKEDPAARRPGGALPAGRGAGVEPLAVPALPPSAARAQRPMVLSPPIPRSTAEPPSATAPPASKPAGSDALRDNRSGPDVILRNEGPADIAKSKPTSTNYTARRLAPVNSSPRLKPSPGAPTYGDRDIEVTPPIPDTPQLLGGLRPSSPNVRVDALTIEVVVNTDGTVDSVRGLFAPQTMGEVVLLTSALSVVKSWHFIPAMKNGVPVRYRHIVPLRDVPHPAP